MIFVTVGLHYQGFDRLIRKMDEIAGTIDEEVVMQIGSTVYKPKSAKYFDFIDDDEVVLDFFKRARIIISHAGAGTLLNALRFRKPVIVVPRQKLLGEHVDDQQFELAQVLSEKRLVVAVYDMRDLESALSNVNNIAPTSLDSKKDLMNFLKKQFMEH